MCNISVWVKEIRYTKGCEKVMCNISVWVKEIRYTKGCEKVMSTKVASKRSAITNSCKKVQRYINGCVYTAYLRVQRYINGCVYTAYLRAVDRMLSMTITVL